MKHILVNFDKIFGYIYIYVLPIMNILIPIINGIKERVISKNYKNFLPHIHFSYVYVIAIEFKLEIKVVPQLVVVSCHIKALMSCSPFLLRRGHGVPQELRSLCYRDDVWEEAFYWNIPFDATELWRYTSRKIAIDFFHSFY